MEYSLNGFSSFVVVVVVKIDVSLRHSRLSSKRGLSSIRSMLNASFFHVLRSANVDADLLAKEGRKVLGIRLYLLFCFKKL